MAGSERKGGVRVGGGETGPGIFTWQSAEDTPQPLRALPAEMDSLSVQGINGERQASVRSKRLDSSAPLFWPSTCVSVFFTPKFRCSWKQNYCQSFLPKNFESLTLIYQQWEEKNYLSYIYLINQSHMDFCRDSLEMNYPNHSSPFNTPLPKSKFSVILKVMVRFHKVCSSFKESPSPKLDCEIYQKWHYWHLGTYNALLCGGSCPVWCSIPDLYSLGAKSAPSPSRGI